MVAFIIVVVLIACSTFFILLINLANGFVNLETTDSYIYWRNVFVLIVLPQVVLATLVNAFFDRDSLLRFLWQRSLALLRFLRQRLLPATLFLYSYFLVAMGFGQRYWFSVSGDDLGERMVNLEWATNTQNTLCFTAVVCALEVLYNQQNRRGDAA